MILYNPILQKKLKELFQNNISLAWIYSLKKNLLIEMRDMGGTCVNRGCIPSKALLAAAKKVRELQNSNHLEELGIKVGELVIVIQRKK